MKTMPGLMKYAVWEKEAWGIPAGLAYGVQAGLGAWDLYDAGSGLGWGNETNYTPYAREHGSGEALWNDPSNWKNYADVGTDLGLGAMGLASFIPAQGYIPALISKARHGEKALRFTRKVLPQLHNARFLSIAAPKPGIGRNFIGEEAPETPPPPLILPDAEMGPGKSLNESQTGADILSNIESQELPPGEENE